MRSIILLLSVISLGLSQPSFDVEGHRGCRGLMPENTIPAFLKALDLGVTTLEMDVVISKDRKVVVSHDAYFNAAFSVKPDGRQITKKEEKELELYRMNYIDIQQYDVGENGNSDYPEQKKIHAYKPLLTEVIVQVEAYRKSKNLPLCLYNIEIKSEPSAYNKSQPEPSAFCDLVQGVLKETGIEPDRIIIQSFDFKVLQHWKHQATAGNYPNVSLSALVANIRSQETNIDKLGFKPDIYSPHYRLINRDKIARLHKQGIRVIPWTVNKRADMERLKKWGVDGLITDYPDRANGL